MNIKQLLEQIKFPEKGKVDKKVFKKAFYENAGLTKQQIDLFKNAVDEVRWHYALKQENINIPAFKNDEVDYQEVEVIGVILKNNKYAHSIAEIIQKSIQYPVILVIKNAEKIMFNVAFKRINKADTSKSVIDEVYNSGWLDSQLDKEKKFLDTIKIKNLSFANFYEFYRDFADRVKLFCVCEYKRDYHYESREKTKELYNKYLEILAMEEILQKKKREIKNESDFSKKVSLNVAIKKIEKEIQQYIDAIN